MCTYGHSCVAGNPDVGRVRVVQLPRVHGALVVVRALRVADISEGLVLDPVEEAALPRARLSKQDHADVVGVFEWLA